VPSSTGITDLLAAWSKGDESALPSMVPLIYDELRQPARRDLQNGRPGHTLQPTALVHEALSPLARVWTPRVTPELQSAGSPSPGWSRLLSVREVASKLRVCTATVYKLCAGGKLGHLRVCNTIRIPESALVALQCGASEGG